MTYVESRHTYECHTRHVWHDSSTSLQRSVLQAHVSVGLVYPYVSHDLFKYAPQLILIYVTRLVHVIAALCIASPCVCWPFPFICITYLQICATTYCRVCDMTWLVYIMSAFLHCGPMCLSVFSILLCKSFPFICSLFRSYAWGGYGQWDRINYRSLWQNIVSFIGLFCKKDL